MDDTLFAEKMDRAIEAEKIARLKWLEDFGKKLETRSDKFERRLSRSIQRMNKVWKRYLKRDYKRRTA